MPLTPEMIEARKRPHIQAAIKDALITCAAHLEQRLAREASEREAAKEAVA